MNINIVFVIGESPLLNSESSIRDKIKNTIISDWQGPNLLHFFFFLQFGGEKIQYHHLKGVSQGSGEQINMLLMK